MPSIPTISVVTACFNSERHLQQTIDSVRAQTGVEVEHLLVDGGSTDGTLALLRQADRPGLRWISEPDRGIADAMNKGIALSRHEWLLFLQSDDYLAGPDVLARAAARFHEGTDICAFPVLFGQERPQLHRARGFGFWLNLKTGFKHQGSFIRRSLFERIGGYDTDFRIAMDYEFFLRAYRMRARAERFDAPAIAVMRDTGVSSQLDWRNLEKRLAEERRLHQKLQTAALRPLYAAWWSLYPHYRRLRAPAPSPREGS